MKSRNVLFILAILSFVLIASGCTQDSGDIPTNKGKISTFSSEEDFKSYLQDSEAISGYYGFGSLGSMGAQPMMEGVRKTTASQDLGGAAEPTQTEPSRVSKTNVQEEGIDEPDIVKTDGNHIYFSSQSYWDRRTRIINSFPVENLSLSSKINKEGKLLLHEDTLIIFSRESIYGYDVSDRSSPEEEWEMEINGSFVDARLYNGKIYLITREWVDHAHPCPIRPVSVGGNAVSVRCSEIYHPQNPVDVDVTYSAVSLDPETGEVEEATSFVGSSSGSVVYMSENGIYITYTYSEDPVKIMYDFLSQNQDLVSDDVVESLEKLRDYDISNRAKMVELQIILERYMNSLSDDERMRIENEMQDRMRDYFKENVRDLQTTGIVKITLDDMEVSENGEVPGRPLNQFSLDEHEGNLRIATTVGGSTMLGSAESANDVYVLDEDLDMSGSVKGLGLTERIYAVRFIGDEGYVVTYRRVDPFYVIDLSDPEDPEMKGKLKIPGYSSYLHPLKEDLILGIGEEDGKVKLSVFDVSDPSNPEEKDKYHLDDYWSEVSRTHHAFLMDSKHKVFFLPGSQGGYVFSYEDEELELVKTISGRSVKRAVYIDNYMYIIGEDEITVLDETDWEEVGSLGLETERYHEQPIIKPMME